jgi:hypothetical protein
MKYIIKDWTGRILFDGKEFDDFYEAWDFIYEADPHTADNFDDHYYDDYYVEEMF